MKIGIPKERKIGEKRVSITPNSVTKLVSNDIEVLIETTAGEGCLYTDEIYKAAGAKIVTQEEVWECEVILKVKEPMANEYHLFKENQIIWGFLHLPANPECVAKMIEKNVCAIASETMIIDGTLQLLKPVSEIAGRRSFFIGLNYLEQQYGGKGILLTGTESINSGNVCVIGGGVVGQNAAEMALAVGCNVEILELNNLESLQEKFPKAKITLSTEENLHTALKNCDVAISTILIPGGNHQKL